MSEARTLLLTRPRGQSEAFAAVLAEQLPGRFRIVIEPLIDVVPVPGTLDLRGVQGLVFTSANGVEQFAARNPERGLVAWCVGDMTAAAACAAGFEARSANGDVAALAALVAREQRPDTGAVLHLRGRHAAGDLAAALAAAGVPARVAEIYQQRPRPLGQAGADLLARNGVEVLAFFSARSARLFASEAAVARWDLGRATAVSLGPLADRALSDAGIGRRLIASRPTREGMVEALASL